MKNGFSILEDLSFQRYMYKSATMIEYQFLFFLQILKACLLTGST